MNNLLNISQQYVYIKDLRDTLDWSLIDQEFKKLAFKPNVGNKVSVEMNFFDRDVFLDARLILEKECKNYLDMAFGLNDLYEGVKLTNSWATLTEPGTNHHPHVHPFSIVSGVIFLDNNPDNLNLFIEAYMPQIPYFITKDKSYMGLKHLLQDTGHDSAGNRNLQNHVILFLSNASHFVETVPANSTIRRTLSFNTFWKGHTGLKNEPLGSYKF